MIDRDLLRDCVRRYWFLLVLWVAWASLWHILDELRRPNDLPFQALAFGMVGPLFLAPSDVHRLIVQLPISRRTLANTFFFIGVLLIPVLTTLAVTAWALLSALGPDAYVFRLTRLPIVFLGGVLGGGSIYALQAIFHGDGLSPAAWSSKAARARANPCHYMILLFVFTCRHSRSHGAGSGVTIALTAGLTLLSCMRRQWILGRDRPWRSARLAQLRHTISFRRRPAWEAFGLSLLAALLLNLLLGWSYAKFRGHRETPADSYPWAWAYAAVLSLVSTAPVCQWTGGRRLIRSLPLSATGHAWFYARMILVGLLAASLPVLATHLLPWPVPKVLLPHFLALASLALWVNLLWLAIGVTAGTGSDPYMTTTVDTVVGWILYMIACRVLYGLLAETASLTDARLWLTLAANSLLSLAAFACLRSALSSASGTYRIPAPDLQA